MSVEKNKEVKTWFAQYIIVDRERQEWVRASRWGIRKPTLNFVEKLFLLLVQNCLNHEERQQPNVG